MLVSWVPLRGAGSSTVSDLVTVEPGGETCTTTGTSCMVSGVLLSFPCIYTVTTTNQSGAMASATMSVLSPRLSSHDKVLALSSTFAPVAVTCHYSECLGSANISVARRILNGAKQVGWRQLILDRAS